MTQPEPTPILSPDAHARIDAAITDAAPASSQRSVHPTSPACPPPPVRIRRAEPKDTAAAWAVEQAAFAETDRFSPRQTAGLITNPRARVFVAEAEGDIVAWIAMLTRRSRSGVTGRLYTVAVSPSEAGRGLGRRLATHAVQALEAEGVTRIYLEVRQENRRAIALYESMGFRIVQNLPMYYGEDSPGYRMLRQHPAPR